MKFNMDIWGSKAKRRYLLSMVVFALIGTVILLRSYAATTSISIEAENGTALPSATIVNNDPSASGGSYIQFGREQGKYIIYTSTLTVGSQQVWRMKADGSEPTRLTNFPEEDVIWARPSPDGTKIIFVKQVKNALFGENNTINEKFLWMMNADGSNQHEILRSSKYGWAYMGHPEWSPDSSKFVQAVMPVFAGEAQLYTFNADGTNPQQVTNNITVDGHLSTGAYDPSWSKDNQLIYIRSFKCDTPCSGNNDLFKLDMQTKKETRLTNDLKNYNDPYLSPDGKTYVWLHFPCVLCASDLYKADANGDNLLTPKPLIADGGTNPNGTFSPDSQYFIFPKQVWFAHRIIHKIKLDGTGLTQVSKSPGDGQESSPAYQ